MTEREREGGREMERETDGAEGKLPPGGRCLPASAVRAVVGCARPDTPHKMTREATEEKIGLEGK